MLKTKFCYKCFAPWDGLLNPGIRETCHKCDEDLHVCLNCRFYDEHKPNQCQNDTDPVLDKKKANFCEEFEFILRAAPETRPKIKTDEDAAREKFRKLFKN
jgi:hypothetical protein